MSPVKSEIITLLQQIERERGIKKEEIIKLIEDSIVDAYKKQSSKSAEIEAKIDIETGEISVGIVKKVVEVPKNPTLEISYEEAKKINPNVKIDEKVRIQLDSQVFSRIAARAAKLTIIQKIKETEKETIYQEFKKKEHTVVGGYVYRFQNKDIIVDLGKTGAEGVLVYEDQFIRERFRIGEYLRVLIKSVEWKPDKKPKIILSRTDQEFVKKIFESEIPEIQEKIVEIVKIARIPGVRCKVVVKSNDPKVDPVGACVGLRGSRIKPIIDELRGEKIDLVLFSEDPREYIKEALSPAKVSYINIIEKEKKIVEVVVPDDTIQIAIGKNGQNVFLASELTGWDIKIKTELEKKKENFVNELTLNYSVPNDIAEILFDKGYTTVEDLKNVSVDELKNHGLSDELINKILG